MVTRGQLDLIENSFQLIADQIVTMQSPHELTGQLDELLDGVLAELAVDTRVLSVDGAGHYLPEERPETVAGAVRSFVAEHEG